MSKVGKEELAVRSHDVLVASGQTRASEFETLTTIGAATRLAVNLRGMPPVAYELLKAVAVHRLGLHTSEVKPALKLLAEAEMLDLDSEGSSIKTVLPDIPYFEDLYLKVGTVGTQTESLNEHEDLAVKIMHRLGDGPVTHDELDRLGAENRALKRVLDIGSDAGFLLPKRARGRDVYIAPGYFSENPQALADLAISAGAGRLRRVLELLRANQGYPMKVISERRELGGVSLDDQDVALIQALAGEGFTPPPSVVTSHSGENHFMFGPRPGKTRLALHETQIFSNALALASSVRQGQFLAQKYAIRHPELLLRRFLERGRLGSNSEAMEQYRSVAQHGVARLVSQAGGKAELVLIESEDNRRAVKMAIELVSGAGGRPVADEELILAMRRGEEYVEPLLSRKSLAKFRIVDADEEASEAIDTFMLGGCS